jgi:SAM-dependent methyltransferase
MNQLEVDHQLGQKLEKEGIQQVHIINQKIREPDDIYDLIIFVFFSKKLLFQHLTPEEMLSECYRILKPGGTLFISVLPKLEKINSPMMTKFIAFFEEIFFDWLFTPVELEGILIKNGFNDIKMFIHPERIFCSAMKKIG